jgi:polar amino acid transport system permease protein
VSFDAGLLLGFAPAILRAVGVTLLLWVACAAFGLALGFLIAVARRYGPRWLDWLLMIPVEIIRGTPFLVQVFLLYYGGPYIGLSLENLTAGVLALSIYASAYYSELWRAGRDEHPRRPAADSTERAPRREQRAAREARRGASGTAPLRA